MSRAWSAEFAMDRLHSGATPPGWQVAASFRALEPQIAFRASEPFAHPSKAQTAIVGLRLKAHTVVRYLHHHAPVRACVSYLFRWRSPQSP